MLATLLWYDMGEIKKRMGGRTHGEYSGYNGRKRKG